MHKFANNEQQKISLEAKSRRARGHDVIAFNLSSVARVARLWWINADRSWPFRGVARVCSIHIYFAHEKNYILKFLFSLSLSDTLWTAQRCSKSFERCEIVAWEKINRSRREVKFVECWIVCTTSKHFSRIVSWTSAEMAISTRTIAAVTMERLKCVGEWQNFSVINRTSSTCFVSLFLDFTRTLSHTIDNYVGDD